MTFQVSPGVYPSIVDLSQNASVTNPNIAAFTGGHTRGPVGPFSVTSPQNRTKYYGTNAPSWGSMIDAVDAFLLQGTQTYLNRVVCADSMYGLGLICNSTVAGQPAGTQFTSIPGGSSVPASDVNIDVVDVELSGVLATGQSVTVTINGITTPAVSFVTSHNETMAVVAQAVQNALDGIEGGGLAWLPPIGTNDMLLRIIGPQAITLEIAVSIAGTGTPPTAAVRAADWLCFVVAQNPGSWSSPGNSWGYTGVAAGITNVDVGVAQRLRLGFSSAILEGQVITFEANGTTVSVPWAVNNNQTLINFCAAYAEAFSGGSASVVTAAAGSNNLQVQLVAPNADTVLTVNAFTVGYPEGYAGAAGPVPTATYTVTLNPVAPSGTFNFVVYENANFVTPDELYLCTYANTTNALGTPTGLEYVINGVSSTTDIVPLVTPSPRVQVTINPAFSGTVYSATGVTNSNLERYLGGAADGSLPSTQQVVTGWSDYSNKEAITVRLLVNAGYATPEVQQAMMSIAANRQDCFCILDVPSNLQDSEDAANYRQVEMDIDAFWGALYSPDVLIYDSTLGVRRYVAPSGQVAAQYAYNDRVASQFSAPAGLNRGVLANALGCRYTYEEGDRDVLSQAQVNGIRFIDDAWTIWGEYTLQVAMSAMQSVPVVRMVITVITEAATTVAYSVFEPNNAFTWDRVETNLDGILQPIESAGGLTTFVVQCDGNNNTADVIQARVMKVAMWLMPVLCALYIQLDAIITRQGASFTLLETETMNQY